MNPSMIAFRQFLLGDYARPNDLWDYIILTFPEPRTEYYSDSSYDNIQNNVVGYANKILNILGFFPISVTWDILQELQTLSMSLVLIGIVFTIIAALFIITVKAFVVTPKMTKNSIIFRGVTTKVIKIFIADEILFVCNLIYLFES